MTSTLAPDTATAACGGGRDGGAGVSAHPVLRFTHAAGAALDRLGDAPAWSMTVQEQREALVLLARLDARLDELQLRVLASADRNDIGDASGRPRPRPGWPPSPGAPGRSARPWSGSR
jgi:hypothetical protein